VYLIKAPTGEYKIGMTKNPRDRLGTFEVKLPFKVDFVHIIKCQDRYNAEKRLHAQYAHKRLNGEWFRLNDQDVEAIKRIKAL